MAEPYIRERVVYVKLFLIHWQEYCRKKVLGGSMDNTSLRAERELSSSTLWPNPDYMKDSLNRTWDSRYPVMIHVRQNYCGLTHCQCFRGKFRPVQLREYFQQELFYTSRCGSICRSTVRCIPISTVSFAWVVDNAVWLQRLPRMRYHIGVVSRSSWRVSFALEWNRRDELYFLRPEQWMPVSFTIECAMMYLWNSSL